MKKERSLFRNRKALEQRYRGDLGVGQLSFRWPIARNLLNDLYDGLIQS